MHEYKHIKYFVTWIKNDWYLIIPEYHKVIELVDYNVETIEKLIDYRIIQYL